MKANEAEPFFWVADYTGQAHLVPGSVGTQWADGTPTYPGLALYTDTSLISPNWPGLTFPAPTYQHLAGCHLVPLQNPTQVEVATKNGWPVKMWNGHAFLTVTSAVPAGTVLYANIYYEFKRP